MDSVNALGYGDISMAKLANKIAQGVVHGYLDDGEVKLSNVTKPTGSGNIRVTK